MKKSINIAQMHLLLANKDYKNLADLTSEVLITNYFQ